MVSEHVKNDRDIPPQNINEEETFYNQHESSRIFGAGSVFLKKKTTDYEGRKRFMRTA